MTVARRIAVGFLPFAAAYFLSYFFRTLNSTIGPELQRELGVDPAALGLVTAVYFAAFALTQIPFGVALDRFGPRRTDAALLVVAACGAVLFATAGSIPALIAGRFMLGLGLAVGLMATFKANVQFWPRENLPAINGITMACGSLGAVLATYPMELALGVMSWRAMFLILAALTLIVAVVIWRVVPDVHAPAGGETIADQLRGAWNILRDPAFLRVAAAGAAGQGAFLAYHTLWAGPWLSDVAGASRREAAFAMGLILVGMLVGYPAIGVIADRLARAGVALKTSFSAFLMVFMLVQVPLALQIDLGYVALWIAFGVAGGCTVLGFALLQQHFPPERAGRVSTCLNMIIFVIAFAIQAGVGWIVSLAIGSGQTAAYGHRVAFLIVLALQFLSWLWFILPRAR